ncbi:uncharacterized protein LOC123429526 [Hordeum vulgare subsp. vulgare]|uniref:uncharacterized protein LOC123429526 n=1 Tax=Hordeum vulgare subsp. vulgare TaxID=112509 RepID=UPI001D1A4A65|nr:uncharacterized protein LOC123429526 [Hordeum vulgare subsp. vulgare]
MSRHQTTHHSSHRISSEKNPPPPSSRKQPLSVALLSGCHSLDFPRRSPRPSSTTRPPPPWTVMASAEVLILPGGKESPTLEVNHTGVPRRCAAATVRAAAFGCYPSVSSRPLASTAAFTILEGVPSASAAGSTSFTAFNLPTTVPMRFLAAHTSGRAGGCGDSAGLPAPVPEYWLGFLYGKKKDIINPVR